MKESFPRSSYLAFYLSSESILSSADLLPESLVERIEIKRQTFRRFASCLAYPFSILHAGQS